MAVRKSAAETGTYDSSAVKNPDPTGKPSQRPAASQAYDQSAAIRPQNTMPVRLKSQKSCDANLSKSTRSKKFVTLDPYAYLREVLTRLPNLTNRQISAVVPAVWGKIQRPLQVQPAS